MGGTINYGATRAILQYLDSALADNRQFGADRDGVVSLSTVYIRLARTRLLNAALGDVAVEALEAVR